MADDSEQIKEIFEFDPTGTPRGMTYYKLSELTNEQQTCLNAHKVNIIRNNQIYLQEHPEIKIITSALLEGVLRARPKYHVHQFMAKYLKESWQEIKKAVDKKIAEKKRKLALEKQRSATIAYLEDLYDKKGFEEEADDVYLKEMAERKAKRDIEMICKNILNELITAMDVKEKHHVQIKVSHSTVESDLSLVTIEDNMPDFE